MKRFALLLVAAVVCAPATGARPRKAPVLEVSLSITKRRAELLDVIPMTITVKNKGSTTVELPPLRIADDAVTIVLADGETEFRLRRRFGRWIRGADGKPELEPEAILPEKLRSSRKVSETLEMYAIRPGTYSVTAEVRGVAGLTEAAVSRPIKLQVVPPDEGEALRVSIRTSHGTMIAELYPDDAYNTCHEFVVNARRGFFGNGMLFFRVMKGFMAQVGCPRNDGTGNAGYFVPAEINGRKHLAGTLSMARATHLDSGGSQFFVMHRANTGLDGKYTVFGRVIENLDVMDKIADVRTGPNPGNPAEISRPLERIELRGVDVEVR